ncbi:MAG: TlpA family protein disulfide reductase [Bacteroidales bacterium]|nr:TlpA family protein disulfide reductase [Bacteroidales bacterium]
MNRRLTIFLAASSIILLAFFVSSCLSRNAKKVKTTMIVHADNLEIDTLQLTLKINPIINRYKSYYSGIRDNSYYFSFRLDSPMYFNLKDGKNYINGFIEPGDSVEVFYNAINKDESLQFDGKGSEKSKFFNDYLQFAVYKKLREKKPISLTKTFPYDFLLHYSDSLDDLILGNLENIKPQISEGAYYQFRGLIAADRLLNRYSVFSYIDSNKDEINNNGQDIQITDYTKSIRDNLLVFDSNFCDVDAYTQNVYNILFMEYDGMILNYEVTSSLEEKYNYLDRMLPSCFKIPVITMFINRDIKFLNQSEEIEEALKKYYVNSEDSVYRDFIFKRYADATAFKKGVKAPDFHLLNKEGEKVSLETFKGKVVYLDFWYTGCSPCMILFEKIKPVKSYFKANNNVVFLCISIDQEDTWKSSLEKFNIDGYHVFTENLRGRHPVIKDYHVGSFPTTCLIDGDGNIFSASPSRDPDKLKMQIEDALSH